MLSENRTKFLKAEGLQLMRLILREQKNARNSALKVFIKLSLIKLEIYFNKLFLKVLSYAMNNLEGRESCNAFVEILGLAVLFPLFMKPVKISKKKKGNNYNNEEHIVSILASLLKNCSSSNKQRIIQKFVEIDYEKIDRLLELFFKYSEEVERNNDPNDEDDEEDEDLKADNYLKRLENGLFALQSISYIILDIYANGTSGIKNRVMKLLNLRNVKKSKIIEIIKEYEENLGEESSIANSSQEEHERIKELIQNFE
jgi:beta-catenin-like protein 1